MVEVRRTALWAASATAALAFGLIVLTSHLSQPSALLGRSTPLRLSAGGKDHRAGAMGREQASAMGKEQAEKDEPDAPYSATSKEDEDPPLAVEMYAPPPPTLPTFLP